MCVWSADRMAYTQGPAAEAPGWTYQDQPDPRRKTVDHLGQFCQLPLRGEGSEWEGRGQWSNDHWGAWGVEGA